MALLVATGVCYTRAQSYSIDWFTVDGGGGTSTNAQFTVSGTAGQPDAGGPMTGGNFSLTGGFWALYAMQTPGAPLLHITRQSASTVAVWWPSPSTDWTLQQNTNSVSSINWSNITANIQDNGTTKTLLVTPSTGNRFYRLTQP